MSSGGVGGLFDGWEFPDFSHEDLDEASKAAFGAGEFDYGFVYYLFDTIAFDPATDMFDPPAGTMYTKDYYTPQGGMTGVINHMSRLIPRS